MKATILVSGNMGSGKTTWLNQVKLALLGTAPLEAVEITVRETESIPPPSYIYGSLHDEFSVPGQDSNNVVAQDASRETWSIRGDDSKGWRIYKGEKWQGTCKTQDAAMMLMRLKTAPVGTSIALDWALRSRKFSFDGQMPKAHDVRYEDFCRPSPSEIADRAGAISAAEAPAIHRLDGEDYDPLKEAALNLYHAGPWQLYGITKLTPSMQERLWERLRNALNLPAGTATAAKATLPTADTHPEEINGCYEFAIEQLGRASDMLETAADVFEHYADLHHAKGTSEGLRKAKRNDRLARMCRETLWPLQVDQDVVEAA